jgi:hypothetical protein
MCFFLWCHCSHSPQLRQNACHILYTFAALTNRISLFWTNPSVSQPQFVVLSSLSTCPSVVTFANFCRSITLLACRSASRLLTHFRFWTPCTSRTQRIFLPSLTYLHVPSLFTTERVSRSHRSRVISGRTAILSEVSCSFRLSLRTVTAMVEFADEHVKLALSNNSELRAFWKILVRISRYACTCYMLCPSRLPWCRNPDICWEV